MIKFYRGLKANYQAATTHADGIYFATDTKELLMNGNAYGIPYTYDDSAIDGRLDTVEGAIDILNGTSSEQGSVAYQIAQIVAGADASFDTLKEIADWILNDTTGAAKMASDISALQTAVGNIDYSGKADKVTSATENNFFAVDGNGNLKDSGYSASSFDAAGTAAAAVAALDATASQSAGADGLSLSITETDGKITAISGAIAANTYEAYGTSSSAIAALDATPSQTAAAANGQLALSLTEVDGIVTAISGSITANTYDAYGAASTAKSDVIGASGDAATANTVYGAKAYADSVASGALTWVEVTAA